VAGVRLGAGLLIALAAGTAAAGTWVLAAIVLAGLLSAAASRTVPSEPDPLGAAAALARVAVFGRVFGAYLFPLHAGIAAVALVLAVTVADLAGLRLPEWSRCWIAGVLALAAAVLVALCAAITPVSPTDVAGPSAAGLPLALVLMFPWLLPDRRDHGLRRVAGATVAALLVAGAALYQLGPVRFGLSVVSLRDVLAAADAASLLPVLAVVVVFATVSAGLGTMSDVRAASGGNTATMAACGVLTAVIAGFASPVTVLVLASVLAFVAVLAGLITHYRGVRD
jgi:hypothetical protein